MSAALLALTAIGALLAGLVLAWLLLGALNAVLARRRKPSAAPEYESVANHYRDKDAA